MFRYFLSLILVFIHFNFYSQINMDCVNSTTVTVNGSINYYDPGGPSGNYANNTACQQTICASTPGYCLTVQFVSLSLDNGFDFVSLYNGPSSNLQFIATNIPSNIPSNINYTSTGSCITFEFTSDFSVAMAGWNTIITEHPCGFPPIPIGPLTASDCGIAMPICTNDSFQVLPSGYGLIAEFQDSSISNPATNPQGVNFGCLLAGELHSTWLLINIASPGQLEFSLGSLSFSSTACYDWIMWPYNDSTCNRIVNNELAPVACNWNATCNGITGMADNPLPPGGNSGDFQPPINVNACEQYLLCFSNYSSVTTTVPVNFFGSAQVSCFNISNLIVNSATICPGVNANLVASGGGSYNWSTGITGSSIIVSPSVNTTYTVSGVTNCGNDTAIANVIVLNSGDPECASSCTVIASSNSSVQCLGQTAVFNASAVPGAVYSWSGPNGFNSSNQNSILNNISSAASGIYTLTVNVPASGVTCSDTTSISVMTCVGIYLDEITNTDLKIYPNPTEGEFTLQLNLINENAYFSLIDLTGKTILKNHEIKNGPNTIRLNDLDNGVYLIEVVLKNGKHLRQKLLKN